ncbi:hypothetical protein [Rhodococcus sp. (in: high G+C Gram-positive bacteria)]|uniref:hypothetical protein n=1 Tax=Rhodococcus sp. TaxID=1831 RepID=UPI003B8A907B
MQTTVDVTEFMQVITHIQQETGLGTTRDVVCAALVELRDRCMVERVRDRVAVGVDSRGEYSVTCAVDELTGTADTLAAAIDRFITAARSWTDEWAMRTGYLGQPSEHADFAEAIMVLGDDALRSALSDLQPSDRDPAEETHAAIAQAGPTAGNDSK